MMKKFALIVGFLLISAVAFAQEIDRSLLQGYDAALVIYNRTTGEMVNINPTRANQRLAPCSTFKIYNTLIGLELGLMKDADDPWYKWDEVKRDIEGWNQDLTLREAFKVSAVPAYQILAREIGEAGMKEYIEKIGYGSQDISSGIDIFWLPRPDTTSIKISADEQVALLNKLLDGKLPFSEKNIAILRDIMQAEKTGKGTLYGKTGSGTGPDGKWNVGWFVGFLEHNGTTYVFACNITGGDNPSGKTARTIIESIFKSQNLL
nr:classD [uncultured bacterium]AMP48181.1 classD [uncultured bacterium]